MILPSVFRLPAFAILWTGRLLTTTATVMQSVAIGWLVYSVARETYDERISMFLVGMIGLAQFVPMFALVLIAGETADRYDRRKILFCCIVMQTFCGAAFTVASMQDQISLTAIFIIAALFGVARAFMMPSTAALVPLLVPREKLTHAIAYNTLSVQSGIIIGPWIGGALCAISPAVANGSSFVLYTISSIMGYFLMKMPLNIAPKKNDASRIEMIREGLLHLWGSKIVLGAITLDLFAVLLGGVTALLPAYAKDVLDIGPEGFGQLRMAFALGAGGMSLGLALKPIRRHAGKWMLGGVTVYGVATLFFAFSREVGFSMFALAVAGAADSISVFVRQNLVQIVTPDAMRGRVSAVSSLFISASNELGEFESGVAARFLGVIGSAVFGGIGSIAITALWARIFPALRKADHLIPQKI